MRRILASLLCFGLLQVHAYDPEHLKKLLEEKECIGCDLRGAELGDAKFIRNDLRSSKFSKTLLWKTHFSDVKMTKTQCAHAKKEEAIFDVNVTCR